jgi:alkanesulfonate monooxygenase SsuD/methylene tetrahydromethanopterin reductase-like flavin-dependent oxidoreductase (luciferase family)
MEFFVFLPQMRLSVPDLVARARAADAAGFDGMTLMDHLAPPRALDQPMYEAMTTSAWLLAATEHLRVGALVLCDSFRHPAVLAKAAVTLDHASTGRFELGIGAGSVPDELATFGLGDTATRARVDRLAESLRVMRQLWSGEMFDHAGRHFELHQAQQRPAPLAPIPIVIGGTGPRMLDLVREHADWWNLPVNELGRFDELRARVGDARPSLQEMVSFVVDEADRAMITEQSRRRFGAMAAGPLVGAPDELVDHYRTLADRGVERVYVWFTDFAPPHTLEAFGATVIERLRRAG